VGQPLSIIIMTSLMAAWLTGLQTIAGCICPTGFLMKAAQPALSELLKNMRKLKGQIIIHLELPASFDYINSLSESGAHLIFNFGPIETRTRLSKLESLWHKKSFLNKPISFIRNSWLEAGLAGFNGQPEREIFFN